MLSCVLLFFSELVHGGCAKIRAYGQAPIRRRRSRGAQLPRTDDRTRWIHLFDSIGKLWTAQLLGIRGSGNYSY